ncbi:hypothetical protein HFX_2085 [Haloferax mediterranei ATCC 33500]|uniref:Peptidase M48 domain-containing protein n=2 Tax=Haloferax mediterranei (strain ATCC 33500 / DSM 1411 / JCM 8866 / NBRC 14739 / NCIMB 2177 / R-4) TaxID=523841 RepID=I3R6B6_HALMT|nr:M48 family metalloprotease [Haloferax mediterranei]AFK19776.1 hypothetical protein HFX_2085 [Haloferax mediterranei ATCC 33500]MDX5987478.1 hypothetical protein [Haloferax mediterranei ATCC 33500]
MNATKAWNRTTQMVGTQIQQRPSIKVIEVESTGYFGLPRYLRVFTNVSKERQSGIGGAYLPLNDTVVIYQRTVNQSTPDELEAILVHEYGHAIQSRDQRFRRNGSGPSSKDWMVATTLREGMAEYVQKAYERRYLDLPSDRRQTRYDTSSTAERYTFAPYFYGMQYYDRRVDSPSELPAVVRTPRATSEQVLHANGSGTAPLSVVASVNKSVTRTQTWGELATRIMLRDSLREERATRATAGWSNDTYYQFGPEGAETVGVVWAHRWDSPTEADQFEDAAKRHLDRQRANTDAYRYRFKRVAPETTVLLAGNETFLDSVAVTASSNESVTVTERHSR